MPTIIVMNYLGVFMRKNELSLLLLIVLFFTGCVSTKPVETKPPVTENLSIQELILNGKIAEAQEMFQTKVDINLTDNNGNTALHAAASVDQADFVTFLILKGADTEIKNNNGETPLHVALKNKSTKTVEILAALNSNIFAKDGDGKSALEIGLQEGDLFYTALFTTKTGDIRDGLGQSIIHYLVKLENRTAIDYCISKNMNLSVEDNSGNTPLSIAYSQSQSIESVRIAASLLLANAAPLRGKYSFFEDAVKTRNPSMRFDDGQTPLHLATTEGETAMVQYLIERGANVQAKDMNGSTPLHEAVRHGYTSIVKLLLANKANINIQDSMGKTPLLIITPQESRLEMYTLLLSKGANPNAKDLYGDTPLHITTMTGTDTKVLQILVDAGADFNERNKKGVTPLALSVERGDIEQIIFFAKQGADINAEDMEGNTPLTRALHSKLEIIKALINASNISSRDSYGNTPLHVGILNKADISKVRFLIENGSEVNARNRNGDSPLFICVQQNNRQVGELLLSKGADVFASNTENYSPLRLALSAGGEVQDWILTSEVLKATDGIGNTPLHYASEWKLDNAVAILLEKGAKHDIQNTNGETPMFFAVKADSPTTINLLFGKGASLEQRDFLGNTPVHTAIHYDARDALKTLILHNANISAQNMSGKTPLHEAARSSKTATITLLLDNGADINATDLTGKTPLIDAIQGQNVALVSLLLSRGASPLIQEMYGRNAYHEAVNTNNIDIINIIREAGGTPLARDTHGRTPFSLVLDKDVSLIAAVLGNDLNQADSDGNTPIHIAVSHKVNTEKLQLLINNKYPVNRRNSEGVTPLLLSVKQGNKDLTRILLQNGGDPYTSDNSGDCAVSYAIKNNWDILNVIVQVIGNKRDMSGESILHYAAKTADVETVKRLISMSLDKNLKNISGETAYDVAIRWQRKDIAELLK
jgi:ankyrin repeat protein